MSLRETPRQFLVVKTAVVYCFSSVWTTVNMGASPLIRLRGYGMGIAISLVCLRPRGFPGCGTFSAEHKSDPGKPGVLTSLTGEGLTC